MTNRNISSYEHQQAGKVKASLIRRNIVEAFIVIDPIPFLPLRTGV